MSENKETQNAENIEDSPRRQSLQRWKDGGWETQREAVDWFRRIWKGLLDSGFRPGRPILNPGAERDLMWLVQGHPDYEHFSKGRYCYFTIEPDGRGNYRFVYVDQGSRGHPFSTNAALTGIVKPLRHPVEEDEPFKGTTS